MAHWKCARCFEATNVSYELICRNESCQLPARVWGLEVGWWKDEAQQCRSKQPKNNCKMLMAEDGGGEDGGGEGGGGEDGGVATTHKTRVVFRSKHDSPMNKTPIRSNTIAKKKVAKRDQPFTIDDFAGFLGTGCDKARDVMLTLALAEDNFFANATHM
ncbi:hypothetical protein N9S81_00390 [bacterium]|nr:hypothetical protein [bacterium]